MAVSASTKTTSTLLILMSFLLLFYISSVSGSSGGADPVYALHKDGFRIYSRKLLMLDAVLDYDDAGANQRHDPRRGRGGSGGRNP